MREDVCSHEITDGNDGVCSSNEPLPGGAVNLGTEDRSVTHPINDLGSIKQKSG